MSRRSVVRSTGLGVFPDKLFSAFAAQPDRAHFSGLDIADGRSPLGLGALLQQSG